ncbi:hypothetical protein KIV65_gp10 [Mycobacterium phage Anthony]|uniref:Uncharacterized protein n=1 Tax=Mycobacterium phage Anthony TaxID=2599857 RepID=A0A5J6TKD3_9CAUD|nr:hypothetical protein KIV65_gp10 [Mycobacterium phage Anthony]QFG10457.1 hypothetical protein PBI_ANTHONY_87 [Mycobacterium phage Anthony]
MPRNAIGVIFGNEKDPAGNPLALVIFRDRRAEYVPTSELKG